MYYDIYYFIYLLIMIFTRYLYYKPNVIGSLFISIAENNIEESLFWGYELYYSGFVNELLEYLLYINENLEGGAIEAVPQLKSKMVSTEAVPQLKSEMVSTEAVPQLKSKMVSTEAVPQLKSKMVSTKAFIKKKYKEFISMSITDNTRDCIIGTIIRNLTICKTITTNKKIRIVYKDKDIIKYRTSLEPIKPRMILSINCIYQVKTLSEYKNYNGNLIIPKQIIEIEYNYNEILENWRTHWEYYSAKSSFWMNIFKSYSGSLNNEKKTIEFKNYEDEERFYDKYGYEPDEQSMEVCIKCLGNIMLE